MAEEVEEEEEEEIEIKTGKPAGKRGETEFLQFVLGLIINKTKTQ